MVGAMMWLEVILQLPWLALDWLLLRDTATCPECGARLYRVRTSSGDSVLRCKLCEKSWVKKEGSLQPLVLQLRRDESNGALR
jgi:tRNA(Ile2) C34 agmatinyltransferase TiaS